MGNPDWLNNHQLLRKSVLCKELIGVLDKLKTGSSKEKGLLLLEMQSASVILAQRALAENKITNFQAKEIFEENLGHLNKAVEILKVEPEEKSKLEDHMGKLSKLFEDLGDCEE